MVHDIFYSNLKFIDSKGPVVVTYQQIHVYLKYLMRFAIFSYFIVFMLFNPLGSGVVTWLWH